MKEIGKINEKAKWITAPYDFEDGVCTFRKDFTICREVASATLYASAMGIYHPVLNGTKIGDNVLAPGITSYLYRVQYQSYDITALLQRDNVLEIGVGNGWAKSDYGWTKECYTEHTSLIAWAEIIYCDGTKESIFTDTEWKVYTSEVVFSQLYHGETVDKTAKIICVGNAKETKVLSQLIPQEGEWIKEQERFAPVEILHTPKGETVIDFGQNLTGYVEVNICGAPGDKIELHHGEVLDKDGNFYNANYRSARNIVTYILSGKQDVFKPIYSFQGFRYAKLEAFPFDEVNPDCFRAVAVYSDMKRIGTFTCGNEKINQLYHNVIWGQKSNYLDIPTDCPQRDERLGWTGDAQVFCPAATVNYDVERFFTKWLRDVALEQEEDGGVRGIIPHCLGKAKSNVSAAFGDAACVIPWELYLAYGNRELLKEHFPMMKKWVEYIRGAGTEEYLWLNGVHYGDWLAMDAGEDSYIGATAADIIASAFFAYSTERLILAGDVLGEDVERYRELYRNIVEKFRSYFMENGMPKETIPYTGPVAEGKTAKDYSDKGITQTALTLILYFRLCKEEERKGLAAKLVELIEENDGLMATGFVGSPYILHALSQNGYKDIAYRLLFEERTPSWLYSVCHGATTIWEHWNGIKEDGSFWSTDMNSFNHYAYGSVFDWIFKNVCGITPMEAGYRKVRIAPLPDVRLGFAKGSLETRNGTVRSHWYYQGDMVHYEVEIPAGVTAEIVLPSGKGETVCGGLYHFAEKNNA